MKRRLFLHSTALGTAALGLPSWTNASTPMSAEKPFRLDYAPHDGMFSHHAGKNVLDQLRFMQEQGFRSFEDNGMSGRPVEEQEKIGAFLQKNQMRMGVFVAHKIHWNEPNLTSGNAAKRQEFLQDIKNSIEVAKRCNAKWMTVVPGYVDLRLSPAYQTANVVESLRQAAALLEPHGLIMVLEPLNFRDHPGQFLTDVPQTHLICKAVDSPSCKILYDLYHIQIQHGNLIPNIDLAWDEIAYFQIGDNPGRKEPGTGEINYRNVFKHIHKKGFKGILGMEHGNAFPDKAGELALIQAYRSADSFE